MQKGSFIEGVLILVGLAIVLFIFILPAKGIAPAKSFYDLSGQPVSNGSGIGSNSGSGSSIPKTSAYANKIFLGSGDGSYEIQPAEEYVTIRNDSSSPVDISGWTLENGKGSRAYSVGSSVETYANDRVFIPTAPAIMGGTNQNLVLKPDDQAIITTGSIGLDDPYRITSFKENECSGYLEALPNYSFTPSLPAACVRPSDEPGEAGLDTPCRRFIDGLSSCQTPTYNDLVSDNHGGQNVCNGCVNSDPSLSNACISFIKAHFSYQGCLNYHENDPEFFGDTWRIFLGRPWELWATDHEQMSLYDNFGKLADYISY